MNSALAVLSVLLVVAPAPAAAEQTFAVLSAFYPASTNRNPDVDASLRLSLFHSRVGSLSGFDLNGIVSQASGSVSGFQLNGIYGEVRGAVHGIQLTGAVNYVGGEVRGAQASAIANYVADGTRGVQLGAMLNYNVRDFRGAQFTAGLNLTEGYTFGVQFAGLANITDGDARAAQISFFLNGTSGEMRGAQLGAANLARHALGIQFGLLNFAGLNRGLQVAAVNVAGEQDGVPVGLVNLANRGRIQVVTFASNLMGLNIGIRTTANRFYSFLAVGGGDLHEGDTESAGSVSWNFGYAAPVASRFQLGGDLGFVHIVPDQDGEAGENDKTHFALQARALGEMTVTSMLSLFAAVGGSAVVSDYSSSGTTDFDPHVSVGIALF